MAAWARDAGVVLRFIEYMDVGHSNGWRLDEVVPAEELLETIGAVWPVEPAEPGYRGEVADRWRYADGGGEFGVISSVTQPFCRDCTRARDVGGGQALHLPVRGRRATTPAGRPAIRSVRRGAGRVRARGLVAPRRPLLRAALGRDDGTAEGRDVRDGRLTGPCPQAVHTRRQVVDGVGRPARESWWITALTDPDRAAATVGPARRGRQDRRTEIASRTIAPPPVASGASLPGWATVSPRPSAGVRARRDVIGIPVSILPSGRRGPRPRPSASGCVLEASGCPTRPIDPRADPARPTSPRALPPWSSRRACPDVDRARARDRARVRSRRPGRRPGAIAVAIPFADLPGWPAATAPGHMAAGCCSATLGRAAGGDAPGPVPPLRGQRPGPRRPAGPAVPRPRGPRS